MNIPADQLQLRLQAAHFTLARLLEQPYLEHDAHVAISNADWFIQRALWLLDHKGAER